ncbi:MAG: ECF transporter S component [Oscillospiraceae bacterium]
MSNKKFSTQKIRKMTVTAILAAVATVLMFFSFNVPLMPSFIKLDFSELPALIAAFALGPVSGVMVCLVKNLVNLFFTTTAGVGELSNFILGCVFVLPAGLIYKYKKTRLGAFIDSFVGAITMAVFSIFSNYYVVYPVYTNFMPMEAIIKAYSIFLPSVTNLWQALIIFNMPFTFIKGMLSVIITFFIYKHISPIIKGKNV